jgi:dephospho-CoA kinase
MIICVTGIFGSGKSTAARILGKLLKEKIVDADIIVHSALRKKEVKELIRQEFPASVSRNKIDRKRLASIVFRSKRQLKKLERIIHPVVKQEIGKRAGESAILDVPLLIETRLNRICDAVIVVKCSEKERLERLVERFSLEEIRRRTQRQLPTSEKARYADFVVDNSGPKCNTEKQLRIVVKALKATCTSSFPRSRPCLSPLPRARRSRASPQAVSIGLPEGPTHARA